MGHRLRRSCLAAPLVALAVANCAFPLDVLGQQETVIERPKLSAPPAIADDKIEDKHPVYDPQLTITERFAGCDVTLNKSAAVTKLDVMPFGKEDTELKDAVFPSRAAALKKLTGQRVMPSMEIVNGALKPFDDGLYAAVELGAEDGSQGALVNKSALLDDLLKELLTRAASGTAAEQPLAREAAAQLSAAITLGGGAPVAPPDVSSAAQALVATFTSDAFMSRPIGFYTWSPQLEAIFRRDRFLQSPPSVRPTFGAFAATAVALAGAPTLNDRYGKTLSLYAGLTNPFYDLSLDMLSPLTPDAGALASLSSLQGQLQAQHPELSAPGACGAHLAFVPASDSPETKLFRNLYCDTLPLNANLIDVLIDRIRSGDIDLTPTAESGWYDRQLYALETLLLPEAAPEKDHLFLTKRYKEKLVETFKSLITQHRETHVKQLGGSSSDGAGTIEPIRFDVYPVLPVEPFPTFYLRTARAYRFLQTVLEGSMGTEFLTQSARVLETGEPAAQNLGAELDGKIDLLYGLYSVAAQSIGMRPEVAADEGVDLAKAEAHARSWLETWRDDADVNRDPRVIVPIHRTDTEVYYWAVIGVQALHLRTGFYPGHEPEILETTGNFGGQCVFDSFVNDEPYTLVEKQVEVRLPSTKAPPTRDELRALCDQYQTAEEIVKAIESS